MNERSALLIWAILLLLSATSTLAAGPSFRTLDQGGYSGIGQATNLVIRTNAEWEKFWKRHQGTVDPPAPVPAVDFEKEMVVTVTMGQKPTGGYAIKIQRIEPTPGNLKIFVAERMPGPDSIVTQAFTAPFHFVAVPKNDLKPDFVMEKKSSP